MQITIGKILGFLIALGLSAVMVTQAHGFTIDIAEGCLSLLLPLALIWFPEQIGSFTGYVGRGGNIDAETPPMLVSIAGWFFLVGLPVLIFILNR